MAIGRFRGHRAWRRTIGLEFPDRPSVRLHCFLQARCHNRCDAVTATSRRCGDVWTGKPKTRRWEVAKSALRRCLCRARWPCWCINPGARTCWRGRSLDRLQMTLRPVDPVMCLYPSVVQVGPPPDAPNAKTILSFQPSGKFFLFEKRVSIQHVTVADLRAGRGRIALGRARAQYPRAIPSRGRSPTGPAVAL